MGRKNYSFIWSSHWHVENNKAWFVGGEYNILFQLDMETNRCEVLAELPNNKIGAYSLNTYCIKCGDDIFCMPYTEHSDIWIYNINCSQFSNIEIMNPGQKDLMISNCWQHGNRIFAISIGLKQIIEINIIEKRIENYYCLCNLSTVEISLSIKVGGMIYTASNSENKIYQFDVETKNIIVYTIPDIDDRFYDLCFDEGRFWLSGYRKKIYVWNKEDNMIKTIDSFPEQFGIYNFNGVENDKSMLDCESVIYDTPIFATMVPIGNYIWCIPFQTNKILYVDKNDYTVNIFEIEEENETKSSLRAQHFFSKYVVLYIKEQRYIGLFSFKNNSVIEIDGLEKKLNRKRCLFSDEALQKIIQLYDKSGGVFSEQRGIDRLLYEIKMVNTNNSGKSKEVNNVGLNIHKENMC